MMEFIGTKLGNYRILKRLGHGGFADVYLGEHVYLHTQAAIKILHAQIEQEEIDRFSNEAQVIAHLIHPHIIRVLDFGVENSTPFLVMEYATGGTLRQQVPRGTRLEAAAFMPYVQQVASALQYAHDQKLIHRDVKPQNMLLDQHGELRLSDFGIAAIEQTSQNQQTEEAVLGTIAYMAPEQLQGKARPASDQYSLAVVVYEWLTGHRPFAGSHVELITQHLTAPPSPIDEQALQIPHAFTEVLFKALAKDAHARFARVQDFADALEQTLDPRRTPTTITTPPTSRAEAAEQRTSHVSTTQLPAAASLPQTAAAGFQPQMAQSISSDGPFTSIMTRSKPVVKKAAGCTRNLVLTLLIIPLLLCGLGFAGYSYLINRNPPSQASEIANNFMGALRVHNYEQAYNDLGATVSGHDSFIKQAQGEDRCYGPVASYTETSSIAPNGTQVHNYTITRSNLSKPYHLHLTLGKDFLGNWHVTDYNSDISSGNPACKI
ncbi:serine/threonine protein kinase [Dictyobacter halimunensis]